MDGAVGLLNTAPWCATTRTGVGRVSFGARHVSIGGWDASRANKYTANGGDQAEQRDGNDGDAGVEAQLRLLSSAAACVASRVVLVGLASSVDILEAQRHDGVHAAVRRVRGREFARRGRETDRTHSDTRDQADVVLASGFEAGVAHPPRLPLNHSRRNHH